MTTDDPANQSVEFNRPGVSNEFLRRAGCAHVGADECARKFGFKAEGIAIPFRTLNGEPIMDGEKPFARVRLAQATDDQKYHQRRDSSSHVYIPPGFLDRPKRSTLVLVEGEFKALSLAEVGFTALGLCGLNGACRTITEGGERTHVLNDELIALLEVHRPARLVFLGDADVTFNAQFPAEAAKLRKLIFGTRRFSFVENVLAAKAPVDGKKGVDDCRAHYGDAFYAWFETLLTQAFDIPARTTAAELFAEFLRRETETISKLLATEGREAWRARVKLLQSTAQLWNEPGAKLELKPLLSTVLGVNPTEIAGLVRDAGGERMKASKNGVKENVTTSQGSALEPWDRSVDGKELLDELRATYSRFMVLRLHGDVLLALWTLHTFVFDVFSFTPYLWVISPEKECGKSTLAELMNHLSFNGTTPGGMSAAAMYRRIERVRPTLLLDEWDTLSDENRQAALNALNTGFKFNGVYTICVGEDHEDRDFHTFCPKAIFGLSEAKLPDTTKSRCFLFPLAKKLPTEKVEKLTRKFDGLILRRKCLRWANDNRQKLNTEPGIPPGLSARQEDISAPLLAIADLCGGQWPELARTAILNFFGEAQSDDGDVKRELLKDIREGFSKQPQLDRFSSAAIRDYLRSLDDRQWQDWNDGKGISQRQISDRLRSYRIVSRNIRIADGKVVKGYYLADFQEAFDRYLSPDGDSIRYSATKPENSEDSPPFASATAEPGSGCENSAKSNGIKGGSGVADDKAEPGETLL